MTPEEDLEDYQAGKEDSVDAVLLGGKLLVLVCVVLAVGQLLVWCAS